MLSQQLVEQEVMLKVKKKFLYPYLGIPLVVEVVVWVSQDQLFQTVCCFVIATIRKDVAQCTYCSVVAVYS